MIGRMAGEKESSTEELLMRVHGDASMPTLIYLPGLHGDWTLVASFRAEAKQSFRFVEFTYPRFPEWSLENYAAEIWAKLQSAGITSGWLLGESFGSLVGWELVECSQWDGFILAGGFSRHPYPAMATAGRNLMERLPHAVWRALFAVYTIYGRFRHRHAPETAECLSEFVSRRTALDITTMAARMNLVRRADLRAIQKRTTIPVYYLAGMIDPIVPYRPVIRDLRESCPGFRTHKIIAGADHTVLATAPLRSGESLDQWVKGRSG